MINGDFNHKSTGISLLAGCLDFLGIKISFCCFL